MLVLSRKLDQAIVIGDDIRVRILKIKGNTIRIGIEAPDDVRIIRSELEFDIDVTEGPYHAMSFREPVPASLQHNRLKELVQQIARPK